MYGVSAKTAVGSATAFLVGFYVANSVVLDLGPHPWLVDLRLALRGGRFSFVLGALSGPVFGALGALWLRRHSTPLGVLVASNVVVWIVEMLLGLVGAAVVIAMARPRRGVRAGH